MIHYGCSKMEAKLLLQILEPIRILQMLDPIRNDIKLAWENYGRSNKSEMTQSVIGKFNGRSRWGNMQPYYFGSGNFFWKREL